MANKEVLQSAGDYDLTGALLVGSSGNMVGCLEQILELNCFQSIDTPYMSGSVIISDADGTFEKLPILGQERFVFSLRTPGAQASVNFREYHAIIYNIERRFVSGHREHTYQLNWTTVEQYKNISTKVSYSFKGPISETVKTILKDDNFLGTRKPINYEQTINLRKYVAPNLRPFQIINYLKEEALTVTNSPNFLFYENPDGFHFRSLNSLFGTILGTELSYKREYREQIPSDPDNVSDQLSTILSLEIDDSVNTFTNGRAGMFGSTLYFHDVFHKNIQKFEYGYLKNSFEERNVANQGTSYGPLIGENAHIIEKPFSAYHQARTFVHPSASETSYHEGNAKVPVYAYTDNNAEEWLQESISRDLLQEFFTLKIEAYGDTDLMCGDLINVIVPSNRVQNTTGGLESQDPILSGKYLVSGLRHQVTPPKSMHIMTITAVKDSLVTALTEGSTANISEPSGDANMIGGGMGVAIGAASKFLPSFF